METLWQNPLTSLFLNLVASAVFVRFFSAESLMIDAFIGALIGIALCVIKRPSWLWCVLLLGSGTAIGVVYHFFPSPFQLAFHGAGVLLNQRLPVWVVLAVVLGGFACVGLLRTAAIRTRYRSDTIYGIRWHWRWRWGRPTDLRACCPCGTELVVGYRAGYQQANSPSTTSSLGLPPAPGLCLSCSNCKTYYAFPEYESFTQLSEATAKEVMARVRFKRQNDEALSARA